MIWIKRLLSLGAFTFCLPCFGIETYTSSISNSSEADSTNSTAVWNFALGEVHPPLSVVDWNDGGADTTTTIEVGDGRHGSFDLSTYANFSENGDISGNVIRINTNTFPSLQFTSFVLNSGWTIRPTGTLPLDIRSLSTIQIDGTIDCAGRDGADITHTDDSAIASGGAAVCGGGAGGDGGTTNGSGTPAGATGSVSGAVATGGIGGGATAAASGGTGGGGGGGYSQVAATAGVDLGGGGGGAGTSQAPADNAFTIEGGGAGGGGGGVYDQPDADNSNGAGGGSGGGIVYLTAVGDIDISGTGSILADGGDGGGALAAAGKGGAGGGGAGGSIRIFSMGEVTLVGPVTALEGSGGTSDGGDGGDGARGRTWITDSSGAGDCFPTGNSDNPQSILIKLGCVNYRIGTFVGQSAAIDTGNTAPDFLTIGTTETLPGTSSLSTEIASSDSTSFTNWISSSSITTLDNKRYFAIRFNLTNDGAITPANVTGFTIGYDLNVQEEFDFTGNCALVENKTPSNGNFLFLLPLALFAFLRFCSFRFTKRSQSQV